MVTMGCGDECPTYPASATSTRSCPDPQARSLEEVRATRDEIARRVEGLVAELDGAPVEPQLPG